MSIVILSAVLAWLVMLLVEQLHSERHWPVVRTWVWRALASNVIFVVVVYVAGLTWNRWCSEWSLFHIAKLNIWADAAITFLAITFVIGYWWHRWRHQFPRLWLLFHQIHHSPRRLELLTTFYKHPMEFVANSVFTSLLAYTVLGASAPAATIAVMANAVIEMFYHWNIRTPQWLGYVVERPESHCVHHMTGVHNYNFAPLPIWDILFGTFRNPKTFERECGFKDGREERIGEMLLCRNVLQSDPFARRHQSAVQGE